MNSYIDQLICRLERINQQLKALESALNLAGLDDFCHSECAYVDGKSSCRSNQN